MPPTSLNVHVTDDERQRALNKPRQASPIDGALWKCSRFAVLLRRLRPTLFALIFDNFGRKHTQQIRYMTFSTI